jgi:hypothetical protein
MVVRAVAQSGGLNTTLLELDGYPHEVTPVPLAGGLPNLEAQDPPRAYLIGHPRGLEQPQFSLQDNLLLDYDETLVHYRSPSEPGSSGSPVFGSPWQLIGLHHAGGFDTPRLRIRAAPMRRTRRLQYRRSRPPFGGATRSRGRPAPGLGRGRMAALDCENAAIVHSGAGRCPAGDHTSTWAANDRYHRVLRAALLRNRATQMVAPAPAAWRWCPVRSIMSVPLCRRALLFASSHAGTPGRQSAGRAHG